MKKAGWLLILISAGVVFYNLVIAKYQNEREMNEHPFRTLFSLGDNLKGRYSFAPPFTDFEIFIIGVGIGGIVLAVIGHQQEEKEYSAQREREIREANARKLAETTEDKSA